MLSSCRLARRRRGRASALVAVVVVGWSPAALTVSAVVVVMLFVLTLLRRASYCISQLAGLLVVAGPPDQTADAGDHANVLSGVVAPAQTIRVVRNQAPARRLSATSVRVPAG